MIIFFWTLKFIFTPLEANYPRPFGKFITSLGGTLGQLLMPFICLVVFLIKVRDTFAASFPLWWLEENFTESGLIQYDHVLARISHIT